MPQAPNGRTLCGRRRSLLDAGARRGSSDDLEAGSASSSPMAGSVISFDGSTAKVGQLLLVLVEVADWLRGRRGG